MRKFGDDYSFQICALLNYKYLQQSSNNAFTRIVIIIQLLKNIDVTAFINVKNIPVAVTAMGISLLFEGDNNFIFYAMCIAERKFKIKISFSIL